jgi:hypothetical protein
VSLSFGLIGASALGVFVVGLAPENMAPRWRRREFPVLQHGSGAGERVTA